MSVAAPRLRRPRALRRSSTFALERLRGRVGGEVVLGDPALADQDRRRRLPLEHAAFRDDHQQRPHQLPVRVHRGDQLPLLLHADAALLESVRWIRAPASSSHSVEPLRPLPDAVR